MFHGIWGLFGFFFFFHFQVLIFLFAFLQFYPVVSWNGKVHNSASSVLFFLTVTYFIIIIIIINGNLLMSVFLFSSIEATLSWRTPESDRRQRRVARDGQGGPCWRRDIIIIIIIIPCEFFTPVWNNKKQHQLELWVFLFCFVFLFF